MKESNKENPTPCFTLGASGDILIILPMSMKKYDMQGTQEMGVNMLNNTQVVHTSRNKEDIHNSKAHASNSEKHGNVLIVEELNSFIIDLPKGVYCIDMDKNLVQVSNIFFSFCLVSRCSIG